MHTLWDYSTVEDGKKLMHTYKDSLPQSNKCANDNPGCSVAVNDGIDHESYQGLNTTPTVQTAYYSQHQLGRPCKRRLGQQHQPLPGIQTQPMSKSKRRNLRRRQKQKLKKTLENTQKAPTKKEEQMEIEEGIKKLSLQPERAVVEAKVEEMIEEGAEEPEEKIADEATALVLPQKLRPRFLRCTQVGETGLSLPTESLWSNRRRQDRLPGYGNKQDVEIGKTRGKPIHRTTKEEKGDHRSQIETSTERTPNPKLFSVPRGRLTPRGGDGGGFTSGRRGRRRREPKSTGPNAEPGSQQSGVTRSAIPDGTNEVRDQPRNDLHDGPAAGEPHRHAGPVPPDAGEQVRGPTTRN